MSIVLLNRFRLLNSEIGNDREVYTFEENERVSFRLLNSEIGNDLLSKIETDESYTLCFRLLNSEIGNDLKYLLEREIERWMFSSP